MRVTNRDEEGYLEAGDLGGGGYGALEGDLGETLRPLAGFGRDLTPIEEEEEEMSLDFLFVAESKSHQTSPGAIVYEMKWTDG